MTPWPKHQKSKQDIPLRSSFHPLLMSFSRGPSVDQVLMFRMRMLSRQRKYKGLLASYETGPVQKGELASGSSRLSLPRTNHERLQTVAFCSPPFVYTASHRVAECNLYLQYPYATFMSAHTIPHPSSHTINHAFLASHKEYITMRWSSLIRRSFCLDESIPIDTYVISSTAMTCLVWFLKRY